MITINNKKYEVHELNLIQLDSIKEVIKTGEENVIISSVIKYALPEFVKDIEKEYPKLSKDELLKLGEIANNELNKIIDKLKELNENAGH